MPRINWLLYFAMLVLVIFGIWLLWQYQPDGPSVRVGANAQQNEHTQQTYEVSANTDGGLYVVVKRVEGDELAENPQTAADNHRKSCEAFPCTAADWGLLAQERLAYWSAWVGVFTAIGIVLLIGTLRESQKAASAAQRLYEIETEPFLGLEIVKGPDSRVHWYTNGRVAVCHVDDDGPTPVALFCQLVNAGRSAAVSARLYRRWSITKARADPPVITASNISSSEKHLKELTIPVGPQGRSPLVATGSEAVEHEAKVLANEGNPIPKDSWVYFHGFLDFADANGRNRARAGFCFVYTPSAKERGFHVAVPKEASKHWYYEKIESPT